MTPRIEKTVFISYRRTNFWTALAVFQNLHSNGYDVFFDYKSIPSGDFEKAIIENITSRAHFILILSPSALERCHEPGDWLRREIETAIESRRNVIPLIMEGFDFGSPSTLNALTGQLAELKKFNAMSIPAEYFDDAMVKLRGYRFLSRPLESVYHPITDITKQITEEQKIAASETSSVETIQLTAEEWLERGYKYYYEESYDEAIRCNIKSIELDPTNAYAYLNLGSSKGKNGDYAGAILDFTEAIRLKQDFFEAYLGRGLAQKLNNDYKAAIADFTQAISSKHDYPDAYFARGIVYAQRDDDYNKAIEDFSEAIRLNRGFADAFHARAIVYAKMKQYDEAIVDFTETIRLKPDKKDAYWGRGSAWMIKEDYVSAESDYQKYFDLGGKDEQVSLHLEEAKKENRQGKKA